MEFWAVDDTDHETEPYRVEGRRNGTPVQADADWVSGRGFSEKEPAEKLAAVFNDLFADNGPEDADAFDRAFMERFELDGKEGVDLADGWETV
jgi:hypothetical protein